MTPPDYVWRFMSFHHLFCQLKSDFWVQSFIKTSSLYLTAESAWQVILLSTFSFRTECKSLRWGDFYTNWIGLELNDLDSATPLLQSIAMPYPQIKLILISRLTATPLPIATINDNGSLSFTVSHSIWNIKISGSEILCILFFCWLEAIVYLLQSCQIV